MGLAAVAAGPGGVTWTVGSVADECGYGRAQIAGYLDGRWQLVPTPSTLPDGCPNEQLTDVAVMDRHTAWAVGSPDYGQGRHLSLIERWDGRQWRLANSPGIAGRAISLGGVAIVPGTRNIWAVGSYHTTDVRPGALHRVNGRWRSYRLPASAPGASGLMNAVASAGRGATWAFGTSDGLLIDRWARGRWWNVPAPPGTNRVEIRAADASSDGDIWAVGVRYIDSGSGEGEFLMLHRTRHGSWRVFASPCGDPLNCGLTDVAAVSGQRAWAVGWDGPDAVLLHWVKPRWIQTQLPSIPGRGEGLNGVTRVPGRRGDFWAVGSRLTRTGLPTALILRRG